MALAVPLRGQRHRSPVAQLLVVRHRCHIMILSVETTTEKAKDMCGGGFLICIAAGLLVFAIRAYSSGVIKLPRAEGMAFPWQTYRRNSQPFHYWFATIISFVFALLLLYIGIMILLGMKADGSSL